MSVTSLLPPPAAKSGAQRMRAIPPGLQTWRPERPGISWLWTGLVALLAIGTRFWALGFPPGKSFDEVYYATEAQEMLRYGYEDNRAYMFIVHPPLGKWFIALSSYAFGDNSWGWRVAPAVAGVLSVIIVTRVVQRMFRSTILGVLAGGLLALDGISVVMSRVALLDIFLQTLIIAGFAALVLDRDQVRGRLAALYAAGVDMTYRQPSLGPRPWRLLGGVLLALAFGVKWSALSFFVGFALLSLWWDRGAFKSAGADRPILAMVRRSIPGATCSLGIIPVCAYLLTWLGWFVGENSWNRHWGDTHPGTGIFTWFPSSIRSLLNYHHQAYQFHSHLYDPHAYKANPWSWLILGRPISFYAPSDVSGCGASQCSREILLIGTPIMYWAFVPMLIWAFWHLLTKKDWRAGVVWMAFAAGWGVWLQNTRRTGFLFYMTPLMPFLAIGVALAAGVMLTRAPEDAGAWLTVRQPEPEPEPAPEPVEPATQTTRAAVGAEPAQSARAAQAAQSARAAQAAQPLAGPVDEGEFDDDLATALEEYVQPVGLHDWVAVHRMSRSWVLRNALGAIWIGAVVADFVWMWPLFTGGLLTHSTWSMHMWFPSWI